ncbi:MAG TPA: ribonuclease H-like YkuK family protein [Bacillales bacterium]|nr:ribonuclease H-like YkuK family protein [Bacillales bacterium]
MDFRSPTYGKVSAKVLTEHIRAYLNEDPKATYRIVIGTDSQTSRKTTMFVTAFIIHRVGKGARFFFQKTKHRPMSSLHQRIYKETELSLQVMEELKASGITELLSKWPIEIHLDIGKHGETRKLIQEVVGWITAVGYVARIKPDAYGASAVADKYTKSLG